MLMDAYYLRNIHEYTLFIIPGNPGIVGYYDDFCVRKDDVEIVSKKLIEDLK